MSRRAEIQVGLTVLAALAVLLWGIAWLKDYRFQQRTRIWHVRFPQTGGLAESDQVQVNGIPKGAVDSVHLLGDHVVVNLALSSEVRLTTDCRVAIRNVGMMGERIIAVDMAVTGRPYAVNDTVQGVYEKGLPEVMAEVGDATGSIARIAEQLHSIADALERQGDVARIMTNLRRASEDMEKAVSENRGALRRTVADFGSAARTARGLTTDREAELRRALDNFSQAAENLNQLSHKLDSLRASIQVTAERVESGEGTLGKLVKDDKLYTDLNASIRSLQALIEDIKANPKKYIKLSIF